MIEINSFPAGKGDCFHLKWDQSGTVRNILIDGGVESTYEFIFRKMEVAGTLDAIILTHVDYDHLGGLTLLFEDLDIKLSPDFVIFINTPTLYLYPDQTDKVKLEHGIDFENVLKKKGIKIASMYQGIYDNDTIDLFGLKISIVSPPKEVLDALVSNWTANTLYQKYEEERASESDKVAKRKAELVSTESILKIKDPSHKWEDDLINSSSIAFIASIDENNFLFLGDSNPSVVCLGLEAMGITSESKLKAKLVKISHHGCRHNTTEDLLSRINCNDYYISTDGSGPYYHPHRDTIVRLSQYAKTSKDVLLNIYSNYEIDMKGLVSEDEYRDWNINFEVIETLTY